VIQFRLPLPSYWMQSPQMRLTAVHFVAVAWIVLLVCIRRIDRYTYDDALPNNYKSPCHSRLHNIRADVMYAMKTGEGFVRKLVAEATGSKKSLSPEALVQAAHGLYRDGLILELGPGPSLGTIATIGMLSGARMAVLDRYMTPWHDCYHARFFHLLRQQVLRAFPGARVDFVGAMIAAGDFGAETIQVHATDGETMAGIGDGTMDAVVSLAVLEHVKDMDAVGRSLARVSKPGAIQIHQVSECDGVCVMVSESDGGGGGGA
jgi:SAM-dependent methyltransferase